MPPRLRNRKFAEVSLVTKMSTLPSVVEIDNDHAQAPAFGVDNSRLLRHVGEPAAIVAEEVVGKRDQGSRVGVLILTLAIVARTESRVVEVPDRIVANIEVEVAVAVEVGEGGRGRKVAVAGEAGGLRSRPRTSRRPGCAGAHSLASA